MSKTGKEVARELESLVNTFGDEKLQDFVSGFMTMHNTVQQKTFGLFVQCIEAMAEAPYVDGRNEASKKTAQLMLKGYKEELIKELMQDSYWTEAKAREHVNADYFKASSLPLV